MGIFLSAGLPPEKKVLHKAGATLGEALARLRMDD